jgi:apolipoprotein N-acyltransferase
LVGSAGGEPLLGDDGTIKELSKSYNSAFLYEPNGMQANEQYNKIHLVPFGEEIPGKKGSWLHNFFMNFSPYDSDYTLDRGGEFAIFKMRGNEDTAYRFGVMICYEDAVPYIGRKFVLDGDGKKRVDWLVNISNDGWFVRFKQGTIVPSGELSQHAAVCVFRAIENRVSVLRSVNTGISCLIDSSGQIRDGYLAGSLPKHALSRTGVPGWFTDRIEIDDRVTFFSRYGQWLDGGCAGLLVLCLILMSMNRLFRNKIKSGDKKYE